MTATVGIDPRIRDRRIAVARDVGHRRLRRVQALGAVVFGFLLAFGLTRSPVLDVNEVRVEGDGVDAELVREALAVGPGEALTSVDTRAAAAAVAALPEISSATVRRSWPGAITVEATAAVPAVAARTVDEGWVLADGDGVVMAAVDELPEGLVVIADLVVDAELGQTLPGANRSLAAVGAALPDDLVWRVSDLVDPGDGTVHARLIDGGAILFGPEGELPAMGVAASAIAAQVPPGCVERIDVLSAQAPVLVRSPAC